MTTTQRLAAIAASPAYIEACIEQYIRVRDAARPRRAFDADYGPATDHPLDPRNDDAHDERLTPEDAESEAREYILSHAESTADWLAKACDCAAGREPMDAGPVSLEQIDDAPAHVAHAVLMVGNSAQMLRAAYRLRELAGAAFRREISERAGELLAEVA